MRSPFNRPLLAAALLAVLFAGGSARAAEITVLAANALKHSLTPLAREFERSSGHKVILRWGGTVAITKRVRGGEAVDIVVISAANIDRLIATGKLAAGSRTAFARSGVGVAVRTGRPKPNVSTADGLKRAILAAKSVGYSTGPSGFYIASMLKKMGIFEQVKGKAKQTKSGVQISDLIARGEIDLGFQQISELLHKKGIQYLGPLPAGLQKITVYSTGLHVSAKPEAKALVGFLTSPVARPAIRKTGMEPG